MNDYDTRCGWCDARYSTKWERAEHEKEEHGTVTDEQVNRIMSGQDKLWDTHKGPLFTTQDGPDNRDDRLADKPYGPGLNVTVPRAEHPATCLCNYCMKAQAERLGLSAVVRDLEARHLPLPEDKMACLEGEEFMTDTDDGITDEDELEALTTAVDGYEGPVIEKVLDRSNEERRGIIARGGRLASDVYYPDYRAPVFALPQPVTAGAICQQAADITAGDRQTQNGDKLPNHENIAALWSAYLGVAIDAHQAATMMVLLKVARSKLGAFNTDDYVDMAGYAGCAAEIRHRSNQGRE